MDSLIQGDPDLKTVAVYDDHGKLTGETLNSRADWQIDRSQVIDGVKYYRIGQNQWLKHDTVQPVTLHETYFKTYSDSFKHINKLNLKESNRALAANSVWYSDRYLEVDGQRYHRISTNEWVSAVDGFEYQPINSIVNATKGTQLYDETGMATRVINRPIALVSDMLAEIDGKTMYRVSSNEWLIKWKISSILT